MELGRRLGIARPPGPGRGGAARRWPRARLRPGGARRRRGAEHGIGGGGGYRLSGDSGSMHSAVPAPRTSWPSPTWPTRKRRRSRGGPAQLRIESVQAATDGACAVASALVDRPQPLSAVPWLGSEQHDLRLQMAGLPMPSDETVLRGDLSGDRFTLFYLQVGQVAEANSVNQPGEHVLARKLIAQATRIPAAVLAEPPRTSRGSWQQRRRSGPRRRTDRGKRSCRRRSLASRSRRRDAPQPGRRRDAQLCRK